MTADIQVKVEAACMNGDGETLGKKAMTVVKNLGRKLVSAMISKVDDNQLLQTLTYRNVSQGEFLNAVMYILTSDDIWGQETSETSCPISIFFDKGEIATLKNDYFPPS
jgi:hypothetical protein